MRPGLLARGQRHGDRRQEVEVGAGERCRAEALEPRRAQAQHLEVLRSGDREAGFQAHAHRGGIILLALAHPLRVLRRGLGLHHDQAMRRKQIKLRRLDLHQRRAGRAQRARRAEDRSGDLAIRVGFDPGAGERDLHRADRPLDADFDRLLRAHGIAPIVAGDGGEQQRAVRSAARERPDGVERMRKRHRAVARHPAPGRLQAGDAAGGGGQAHRATGVGAERAEHQARGDRGARAARGAAGDVVRVPGVAAVAPVLVVPGRPVSELGHVERADIERARGVEALERGRGLSGRPAAPDLRAAVRYLAGAVEHVLVRERDGAEGAFARAVARLLGNEGVDARLPTLDATAAGLQQIFRG